MCVCIYIYMYIYIYIYTQQNASTATLSVWGGARGGHVVREVVVLGRAAAAILYYNIL